MLFPSQVSCIVLHCVLLVLRAATLELSGNDISSELSEDIGQLTNLGT